MHFNFINDYNRIYNKDKTNIILVAVSKNRSIDEIKKIISFGIKNIAENKIQEAERKYIELKNYFKQNKIKFHFIGHLQSNKAKKAVSMFDVIQSIDSLKIAKEVNKRALEINKIQEIFIQINIGNEKKKFGIKKENLIELIDEIIKLKNLNLNGLMSIAPNIYESEKTFEKTRVYFKEMKLLFDNSNKYLETNNKKKMEFLSMGMTNDYKIAVEEGSNMIRIGRGLFEKNI